MSIINWSKQWRDIQITYYSNKPKWKNEIIIKIKFVNICDAVLATMWCNADNGNN